MAFLSLRDISKTFGSIQAVVDFNLEVEKGEFVAFLGPSGCGKTTTLRMIAGFEQPTAGRILLENEDITDQPPNRRNIGMVFQSYALFPNMTVAQNIGFGLRVRRMNRRQVEDRVREMLALIRMEEYGERYPYQLSGGQQQRVALARALAIRPRLLLLDEPLSALDAKIRLELRQEIRRIQQTLGITTIYVTHDQEEALSLSDRVVVMKEGRIEQIGTPFEIYNYPQTEFVASFVGQLNLLPIEALDLAAHICWVAGQEVRFASFSTSTSSTDRPRLAIRPEEIRLGSADGENLLRGQVEAVIFLGAIIRLRVKLREGILLLVDQFNERNFTPPRVGEAVTLHFPIHACWLI
ncbi:MAG: ABC transporter ATP-binding protein [Anaerolineae bacterium]|nr:ABC transporter ATP-binding protein [Anaerolineae bacterium]MDW8099547.1 ABC transporter ATP-binding protein [Anaerolineae bacterium]